MGEQSKIEWTDATWNPWVGCTKVSAACTNCYMFRDMRRYGRDPEVVAQTKGDSWGLPIKRWRRGERAGEYKIPDGKRVFTCSWSDWFHEAADRWRDQAWDIIRQRPGVTFQILTKRVERIAQCLPPDWGDGWPNVWLGVTVEDQQRADERIPWLLATPAHVRFLSCEPLLGPIDLKGWGSHSPSADWKSLPEKWRDFDWPDWVPSDDRGHIEKFWGEGHGRSPREWGRDHVVQHVPATGSQLMLAKYGSWYDVNKMATSGVTGRYLHCWNNIGRLITDGGESLFASGGMGSGWLSRWLMPDDKYRHKLNQVIVGGESGPHARPTHPDWARGLRDQCQAAGVPFFFKQWGEWGPRATLASGDWPKAARHLFHTEKTINTYGGPVGYAIEMLRVGKSAAGRLLDGRDWNEFPNLQPAATAKEDR